MKFIFILIITNYITNFHIKIRKQIPPSHFSTGGIVAQIGESSNIYSNEKSAITNGTAGNFSKIPSNHPILNMKEPKYVEQLHYYEDSPEQGDTEAISINKEDGPYYNPFQAKLLIRASGVFNCELIDSPFVCMSSNLCNWDNLIRLCTYAQRPRFKQKKIRHRKYN